MAKLRTGTRFGEKDTMKTNYSSSLPGTPTIEEVVMLKHIRGIASEYFSDAESEGFKCAVLLLASLSYGTDSRELAQVTGLRYEYVAQVETRCRQAEIWVGEEVMGAHWEEEELGGLAFVCDVCVAEGKLIRRTQPDGEYRYRAVLLVQ